MSCVFLKDRHAWGGEGSLPYNGNRLWMVELIPGHRAAVTGADGNPTARPGQHRVLVLPVQVLIRRTSELSVNNYD